MTPDKIKTSIYVDAPIWKMLSSYSQKTGIPQNIIVSDALANRLKHVVDTKLEKEYLEIKEKEIKNIMLTTIRSRSAKKMMIVSNVKFRIRKMLGENGADSLEEAYANIDSTIDICKSEGWERQAEQLLKFKDDIKNGKGRIER